VARYVRGKHRDFEFLDLKEVKIKRLGRPKQKTKAPNSHPRPQSSEMPNGPA
jgi:hypothetical protein